jgi:DNA-binding response OmpR family regulator
VLLLIADDDVELCKLLHQYFQLDGIELDMVHRGDAVLATLQQADYDLLILDIMLPGKSGLDVLRDVRRAGNTPVLMLSARGEEMDRIVGLELGADDYLPKPCSPRELSARARSILRRAQAPSGGPVVLAASASSAPNTVPTLTVGDLDLNVGTRQVRCGGRRVELTGAEFSILHELLKLPGQVIDKDALSRQALGRRLQAFDRSLDTHVSNLRKKLGVGLDAEPRITAVRGAGYVYVLPSQS